MFKAARWRNEKNKIKAVFKLQFKATQMPVTGWEAMMVTLVPIDVGKPSIKSEKSTIINGECRWLNPVYETVKLSQDAKTGKISDKVYQFIVSAIGSARSGVLGEIKINVAEYAEVFKPTSVSMPLQDSNNGAILHVTIQRVQGDAEGREILENGEISKEIVENRGAIAKQQRRTLMSKLSNQENEGSIALNGANDVSSTEEGAFANSKAVVKFHSSRNMPHENSSRNLQKSSSFDAISVSGSESSSGQYTPNDITIKNNSAYQDNASLLSLLSNGDTRNTNKSTNCSGETDNTLERQKSDLDGLARQLEVSELELHTLRKQVVKESRRGHDLLMELNSLKEERDTLKKECEELKNSKKRAADDENFSSMLQYGVKDPWSMLEEMKEELDHEKNLNDNLRLQLQKTQNSNAELIFAVRDLEELLEQKTREKPEDMEYQNQLSDVRDSEIKQESIEMSSDHEEEQYELDVLVKEHDDIKVTYSQERKFLDLNSELELYKKDREDIEMQMEQLALDYEILKQENHDISSRLEQIQLREQLRMQYECSAHLVIINDLESHVECLEKELEKQAEVYEANLSSIIQAKVEQEQRAIQTEEELRLNKWNNANTIENLKGEFIRLSSQISTTFHANEEMVMKTLEESRESRLEKCRMMELLGKSKEELLASQRQHQVKCQQLLSLIDFKTKEVDKLHYELNNTRDELANQKKYEEAREKALREEMEILKTEMEQLSKEKSYLSELIEQKEKMVIETQKLQKSTKGLEKLLQEANLQRDMLGKELSLLEEEARKSLEELKALRQLKVEQDVIIKTLNFKVQTLTTDCTNLKQCLSDDESELEILRKQVMLLRGDLRNETDMNKNIEKRLEDNNEQLSILDGTIVTDIRSKRRRSLPENDGSQFINNLHVSSKYFDDNDNTNMKSEDHKTNGTKIDGNHLRDTIAQEIEFNNHSHEDYCERIQSNLDADALARMEEYTSFTYDRCRIAQVLSEMEELKERNNSMEAELREMQERYSEMSLKFAEVEGERQQLVIRIRMLKNASKF